MLAQGEADYTLGSVRSFSVSFDLLTIEPSKESPTLCCHLCLMASGTRSEHVLKRVLRASVFSSVLGWNLDQCCTRSSVTRTKAHSFSNLERVSVTSSSASKGTRFFTFQELARVVILALLCVF